MADTAAAVVAPELDVGMFDIDRAARALEGSSASEILRWASAQVPRLTFAT